MADLLESGAAMVDAVRHAHMTRTVTYQRGAASVSVSATIGRTEFEQADSFGIIHRIESRDFLVRSVDLVLDGSATLPEPGDRILDSDGSHMHIYEVMSPGGEPPFRFSDPYRKALRIHTKHVATEGP